MAGASRRLLRAPELETGFAAFEEWTRCCGFVPEVVRAQTLLPHLVEAESRLALAILTSAQPHGALDVVLRSGLSRLLGTLASALDVACEIGDETAARADAGAAGSRTEAAFDVLERTFGFVPAMFRAQTARPEALAAEARFVEAVCGTAGALSPRRKGILLLAIAVAERNTSCATLHAEMLRILGVEEVVLDRLVVDYRDAGLAGEEIALVDMAVRAAAGGSVRTEIERLRSQGVTDPQILEAIVTTALGVFLTTVQRGLGTPPDFEPRHVLAHEVAPDPPGPHLEDPDAALVGRARTGDVTAFEELVRRHHRRMYRAALAVTGNEADAEDAAQLAFVKAFNALATFERTARFTTWLTRIAINEALSRVRARRPAEQVPLDEDDELFRPAAIGAWMETPEQLYERGEMRRLIERALGDMPVKYRMAVVLRDVEQLSTIDAAAALGLPVPTLKKHLLKGRLLLREALAPHFTPTRGAVTRV